MDVLVYADAVTSGAAAKGAAWQYYPQASAWLARRHALCATHVLRLLPHCGYPQGVGPDLVAAGSGAMRREPSAS